MKFNLSDRRPSQIEANVNKYNFNLQNIAVQNLKSKFFNPSEATPETADKYAYLGTPVFSNLEIPAGEYLDNDGATIDFKGLRIDTVLFTISIEKNIVRTAINGRDGTVKQFVSLGDYAIDAQGLIIGESDAQKEGFSVASTGAMPEAEIRKLNAILRVPQEIEVFSEFLLLFDVSTVVIENGFIGQKEGFSDTLFFSLAMLSDTPIELK